MCIRTTEHNDTECIKFSAHLSDKRILIQRHIYVSHLHQGTSITSVHQKTTDYSRHLDATLSCDGAMKASVTGSVHLTIQTSEQYDGPADLFESPTEMLSINICILHIDI